jgi:hypothetical protein
MYLTAENAEGDNFDDGEQVQVLYIVIVKLIIKVLPESQ